MHSSRVCWRGFGRVLCLGSFGPLVGPLFGRLFGRLFGALVVARFCVRPKRVAMNARDECRARSRCRPLHRIIATYVFAESRAHNTTACRGVDTVAIGFRSQSGLNVPEYA